MSNPWDDFTANAESAPWDDFATKSNDSPIKDFFKGAKGTAAAVADIAAGIPKIGARTALAVGGKLADPSRNLQDTWDTAGQAIEETFPSFGKNMQNNIGYTAPMKPFELYGEGVEWAADKASFGNKDVQGALNIAGNFAPIPFAGKAVRGAGKVIEAVDPGLRKITPESVRAKTPATSAIEALKAEEVNVKAAKVEGPWQDFKSTEGIDGQLGLFDQFDETVGQKNQFQADPMNAVWRTDENGMPIRADLSMEVRNLEQPLQRNLFGDELGPALGQEKSLTGAIDSMERTPIRDQGRFTGLDEKTEALKRLQGEIEAPVDMQVAKMEADGPKIPLEPSTTIGPTLAENAARNALRKRQGGGVTTEIFPTREQYKSMWESVTKRGSPEAILKRNQDAIAKELSKTSSLNYRNLEDLIDQQDSLKALGDLKAGQKFTNQFIPKSQRGAINPEVFKEGFEKVVKGITSGVDYIIKSRPDENFQLNAVVVEAVDRAGKKVGEFTFGEKGENLYAFGSATVPEARRQGIAKGAYQAIASLGNDVVPSSLQSADGKAMWKSFGTNGMIENGRVPNSQRGAIKLDWSKKREMEQLGKVRALRDVLPELTQAADTPEGIAAVAKNTPDIPERGLTGKSIDLFTKGLLFENFKTNNPILKYTYQTISNAVDASTSKINRLVSDTLTPVLRKLSNKEMGELGDVMVQAMKLKKDLSPEFLREHGFNEKQINAYETQKAVHKENFDSLNKARELAGKAPVTAYQGYIAGLASGNFRKVIYKKLDNGTLDVVGIVGSDFRHIMESRVKALLKEHPEYSTSVEKFTGTQSANTSKTALTEALNILSDSNPNFTEFAKALEDAMTSEGYNALGAKKHTMGKKGVFGMEGDKPWQSSYENAKDMFNAQVRYTETITKWAEFSKAIDKLTPIFSDPEVQLKQPNALKVADAYIKNAMGQNPSQVGKNIDNFIGSVGSAVGVGPSIIRGAIAAGRNTVNSLFFSLNHAWMAVNVLQPFLVMPEVKAFLRGRGIELNLDITGVSDNLIKGGYSSLKHVAGWNETPFEKSIWKYAKEHGIDQTNLIESHNSIRGGPVNALSQGLKLGANAVEAGPRAMIFSTLAQMLHDSGYSKDPALLDVARQLTDMSMADYRPQEQIKAIQHLGMAGGMAANLTSFKQNTLSRYALFGRELGKGNSGAFTTALITAVAYAGVMGLPGFTEMDSVVEQLSKMMGKPTTLTKLVLDASNKEPGKMGDVLAMGTGAYYGLDLHNRIGMPSAMPTITGGFGKLVDIGKEAVDLYQKPNEWNAKQLARQVAIPPSILGPWMDLEWFSHTNEQGDNLALNKAGMGTVVRNKEDLMWKRLGFLGSNESKGKALDYATTQQDKYFADKQKNILAQVQEITAVNKGTIPDAQLRALISDYQKVEGDTSKFIKGLESAGVNLNTTTRARRILANQGGSLENARKLERTRGQ